MKNGFLITSFILWAIYISTSFAEIPSEYEPYVEHRTKISVYKEEYDVVKISYNEKKFEDVAFDSKGNKLSASIVREAYKKQFSGYGKIHLTLRKLLEEMPDEEQQVMIWLQIEPLATIDRPKDTTDIDATMKKLENEYERNLDEFSQEKDIVLEKLVLDEEELEQELDGTPFVIAMLTPERIKELEGKPEIFMLLAYDPEGIDDLEDAMVIAGADIVINSGITGDGVKVAVFEDCPDDTTNLDIEDSYSSSEEIECDPSQHARHVTGIIKNITAVAGFAPDATVYSADDKDIDALNWAVYTHFVSVVNQSFHRAAEIGDGLQADDLYKDYLVLQYPWPTIVQAAGNWCSVGSTCYESGNDVLSEYVNHKGFNTISVGNHNDDATQMSASSCFVNPTSPHGDRELPEIAANGTNVTAVGLQMSGTSMASPAVVGSVALLQSTQQILRIWPEGVRALLFAGSNINVPQHAGQTSTGGNAADAPNNWWQDVSEDNDAFDGAGALNIAESIDISENRYSSKKKTKIKGWDIGTFTNSSFNSSGFAKKTYKVKVTKGKTHVKVALAWNSTATITETEPEEVYASTLGMDLDLRIYNSKGGQVAYSLSWDNSYEIVDFDGSAGVTYTIKIHRWSAEEGAWSWYGIAWDTQ